MIYTVHIYESFIVSVWVQISMSVRGTGTCSQTCTNTDGSYTCSCVEGYLVQPDNRSCKAKNGKTNITVQDKIK